MTPENLISELQSVPYVSGGNDWNGGDCWFIVEAWYKERFGVEVSDRGTISPGPNGVFSGFNTKTDWHEVQSPNNDDLVIMHSVVDRQRILAGHVGVFWNGSVLHSDKGTGCILQPLTSRQIKHRVTCYLRHNSLN